jgi:RPA43 OB domain in RNA Pol I
MGKRKAATDEAAAAALDDDGTTAETTTAERRERKRLKKELKQRKKEKKAKKRDKQEQETSSNEDTASFGCQLDGFWKRSIELTISLLPSALSNVMAHIEEALRNYLLKYSDDIGGILLAFENVSILSHGNDDAATTACVGTIYNELPHIHYRVSADALVFDPSPGTKLVGSVVECSFQSHLSLLVHEYFNASVSAEQMRACGFEFDDEQRQWYWQDTTKNAILANGDSIDLVCQKLYESGGIISIEGSQPAMRSKEI